MWSASSSTVTSTASSDTWRCRDVVLEAARTRHDDVDPAPEGGDLRALAHPAEDRLGRQTKGPASGAIAASICATSSRVGARMSARGRVGWRGKRLCDSRASSGRSEGDRLARPRAAAAEHVTTGEGVGKGRRLDRGGRRDPAGGEDVDEGGGHAERGEGGGGHRWSLWCVGRRGHGRSASTGDVLPGGLWGAAPRRDEVPMRWHRHQRSAARGRRRSAFLHPTRPGPTPMTTVHRPDAASPSVDRPHVRHPGPAALSRAGKPDLQ